MRGHFIIIASFFQLVELGAQTLPILTDQLIIVSEKNSIKGYDFYEIGEIDLYNSIGRGQKNFYIVDKITGNKIFSYEEDELEAKHLVPTFFMAEGNASLIILCVSLEGDHSWGSHFFIIDNKRVTYSGFVAYGVDNFNFSGIALYGQFEQHGDSFVMFFQDDVEIIDFLNDELINGSDLEITLSKTEVRRSK